MGNCCVSDEQSKQDSQLRKELKKDQQDDSKIKKLLFLGSGGSGKSTLFKQLRSLHGSGFGEKDRLQFKEHIYAQIIEQMRLVLECIELENESEEDGVDKKAQDYQLSAEGEDAKQRLLSQASSSNISEDIAEAIKTLWKEEAVNKIYEQRAVMKIEDSSAHFWDSIDRVTADGFVPDDQDILLVRYRTTGVIEQKFEMKQNKFHVFDVGGQKSERKKWIHCFEMVTAVIFVAAMSCYDEVMFEDEERNSMSDSIELFGSICNNEYLFPNKKDLFPNDTAMILFLNKKDLFAEKILSVPITVCPDFKDYKGPDTDFNATSKYIKEVFEAKDETYTLFTHLTCAVDKNHVEKVFNDIQTVIIHASLASGGLISLDGGPNHHRIPDHNRDRDDDRHGDDDLDRPHEINRDHDINRDRNADRDNREERGRDDVPCESTSAIGIQS